MSAKSCRNSERGRDVSHGLNGAPPDRWFQKSLWSGPGAVLALPQGAPELHCRKHGGLWTHREHPAQVCGRAMWGERWRHASQLWLSPGLPLQGFYPGGVTQGYSCTCVRLCVHVSVLMLVCPGVCPSLCVCTCVLTSASDNVCAISPHPCSSPLTCQPTLSLTSMGVCDLREA